MSKKNFDYYSMEEDKNLEQEIKKGKKTIVSLTIVMVLFVFIGIGFGGYKLISFIGDKVFASSNELLAPSKELIEESTSMDGKYTVKTYLINGGATTSYSVRGILYEEGKSEKEIYSDYKIEEGKIIWVDNDTVKINDKEIDLPNGKYDWKSEM